MTVAHGPQQCALILIAVLAIGSVAGCTSPVDGRIPPQRTHYDGPDDAKYLAYLSAVYLNGIVPNDSVELPLYRGDYSDIDDFIWQRSLEGGDVAEEGVVPPSRELVAALLMPDEMTGGPVTADLPYREALFVRKDGELFRVRQPEVDHHPRAEVLDALLNSEFEVIARADTRWWRTSWWGASDVPRLAVGERVELYFGDFSDVERFVWLRDGAEHELFEDEAGELIAALELPIANGEVSAFDIAYRYPALFAVDDRGTMWRVRLPTRSVNGPPRAEVTDALNRAPFTCVICGSSTH